MSIMRLVYKIIVVDDSDTFREGLRFYIENILKFEIIDEASNGIDFLELDTIRNADVILMDMEMPLMNGVKTVKKVLENYPHKVIAITNYEDKAYLNQLILAGFKGCIIKKNIHEELEVAIRQVVEGGFYFQKGLLMKKVK